MVLAGHVIEVHCFILDGLLLKLIFTHTVKWPITCHNSFHSLSHSFADGHHASRGLHQWELYAVQCLVQDTLTL